VDFIGMEVLIEKSITYGLVAIFMVTVVYLYIRKMRRENRDAEEKIEHAIEFGFHEPVTLHPVVDANSCIKSGACVTACPEKDILGIRNGKATVINASRCIGHGACVRACPMKAITLCIGTEKRGVDIPEIDENFETNVSGIYIAGEMGGMGLIKNAVEQGKQAINHISGHLEKGSKAQYDVIIVGSGPAGISATLAAKKAKLNALTLEQDSLGGTIASFPRSKIVMTSPMDLPLHGKVKFYETNKSELLKLWNEVLDKNRLSIREYTKVDSVVLSDNCFEVNCLTGEKFTAQKVLLAIGRRGTPTKLDVSGENLEKVYYRLIEPELILGKKILVVGGGDSAVESSLLLADANQVTLSYRGSAFSRINPQNNAKIADAIANKKVNVLFSSKVISIDEKFVSLYFIGNEGEMKIENDLVYIFAGGELPYQFLKNIGINFSRKHGETILKG
jgi:thioredoxin reductase (NADPH)